MLTSIAPRFSGLAQLPPVDGYSQPAGGNGNRFLRLRQTDSWLFAHRENAKGAVHALTLVRDRRGVVHVQFVLEKRPPLGGRNAPITIQLPAGLIGDHDEHADPLSAARGEVFQELGLHVLDARLLSDDGFMTSPGVTTEQKAFALIWAEGQPHDGNLEEGEKGMIVGYASIPLTDFLDGRKFAAWCREQTRQGRIICMDVLAARGLIEGNLTGAQRTLAMTAGEQPRRRSRWWPFGG